MSRVRMGSGLWAGFAFVVMGSSLLYVFQVAPWQTRPYGVRTRPDAPQPVPSRQSAAVRVDVAPSGAAAGEARDGHSAFGHTFLLTEDGLAIDGRPVALPLRDAVALATLGEGVFVGQADGTLTRIDASSARELHIEAPAGAPPDGAAVTELVSDGERLYVGTRGAGLLVWDGEQAFAVTRDAQGEPLGEITALALGERGLALGTADGAIDVREGGRVTRLLALDTDAGRRVTALAWDGDALYVGTFGGVARLEADGTWRHLRRDVQVTSLLFDAATRRLYVGTEDQGVLILTADGQERRLGQGRVGRLRLVGGRPVAFGDGGAWELGAGDTWPAG
jgi:ligand-binding sensor domain-containing protein